MTVRGIRGATVVAEDKQEVILSATRELLEEICEQNPGLIGEDIGSILFTMTPDLCAAYPALAAREMGWVYVPMLCAQEIPVPGNPARVIRVLINWNTNAPQQLIQHVYLHDARILRPDIISKKGA
jgi:chorismate mutase